jgi:hypothetical protein
MPEGVHLDGRALKLLRELADLDVRIANAAEGGKKSEARWVRLTARRITTRRRAKKHCEQAGISWKRFDEALKRAKKG